MIRIEKRLLSDIKPYGNNPRKNDSAVPAVTESIKQCGYVNPVIIDEDGVILAGHTRYMALLRLGWEEAEVAVAEGLTEVQKRKYRILDNKVGELSVWDYEKLLDELDGLDFGEFAFGFEKLTDRIEQDLGNGFEYDAEDFSDDKFDHECPECGFRFND